MKRSTIHGALDFLDEQYIAEGIELCEHALLPQRRKKKALARIVLIAALLVFSGALLLFPLFLSNDSPVSSDDSASPVPSGTGEPSISTDSPPPAYYDPYTLIDFEVLPYNDSYYLYFPESALQVLQVGSAGNGPTISDPTILPEFDDRMTFFPFESVSKMIEMFTAQSQMPLWFAEYILDYFPKSGDRIWLPDFKSITVPTLPQSFRLGNAYLSGEHYCVQIRSDHFTNGLYSSFHSREEYEEHYEQFLATWANEEEITVLKTYEEQSDGLLLTITDYLQDSMKYKRVQTTLTSDEKTIHVIAVFPFPHLGSTAPINDTVLPQEITLYIEQGDLYGNIYLTQFGKNITNEELFGFGIEKFEN